jgi:Carboxypeptidase regulatory-like domain
MSSVFHSKGARVSFAAFVFVLFLNLHGLLNAQEAASLTGVVTDASGAVVSDVDVKLVDTKTNTSYQTKTNSVGAYLFAQLAPGPGYRASFSKQGFDTMAISDVYLAVNATHTQNVQLKIGATSETVEVNGEGSTVTLDTTDTTIGNNFDMREVHDLPVIFRDSVAGLFQFEPGVVAANSAADDPNNSRTGAVTGSRIDQGNITLDGIDVNDFSTGQAFVATANAPVDSIQEFRGETANPLAAEGRGSGAQISLVTKSGTNTWHGSLSEYFRNTVTEANDWFNIRAGIPRTQLNRNQFGGTIGGPIKKDKAFFFIDYNGRRDAQTDNVVRIVPLGNAAEPIGNLRNGGLAYINSGANCSFLSRINTQPDCISQLTAAQVASFDPLGIGADPALLSFIQGRYPEANDLTVGDGINTGGFRFSAPDHLSENNLIAKVDFNLGTNHRLFAKYSIIGERLGDNVNGATIQFPGDPVTHFILDTSYVLSIGDTWTISANKVNQFVFGEARSRVNFPTRFNPAGPNYFSPFADNGSGSAILSSPYQEQAGQRRDIPIPIFRDDFSYTRGTHNFQIGGTFKPITATSNETLDLNFLSMGLGGNLTGLDASFRPVDLQQDQFGVSSTEWDTSLAFTLGRYASIQQNLNYNLKQQPTPQDTGDIRKFRYYETEMYAQDTWRVRNDLTLTYGLRWQFYSVPYETQGYEAIPSQDLDTFFNARVAAAAQGISGNNTIPFVTYTLGGKANHGPAFYKDDWKDFAPRLSVAYNPAVTSGLLGRLLGDRKTVIRAGSGIIFDHPGTEALNFEQNRNSYLFSSQTQTNYGTGDPATDLANDPRYTGVTDLPPGMSPPQQPTIPFTPYVDSNGIAYGEAVNTFNYAIDRNLKTPYNIVYTFGIQRELPGRFQLDVNYFGRFGRRLLIQADAGQMVDFTDPASGHLLSQDFANLSLQMRNQTPDPVNGYSVTPLPFFEDIAFNGATNYLANGPFSGLALRGDLADATEGMNIIYSLFGVGFPPGIGMSPQFDTNVYVTNKSFSSYNALLTTLHKKMSKGLQFDLNYTYAHSIDNASVAANSFFSDFVCDITSLKVCKGDSDFDVRHAITMTGIYELPFGRGRTFGGQASGLLNQVIGGWALSGIENWHTGFAFRTGSNAFPIGFAAVSPGIFNGDTHAIRTGIHTDPSNGDALQFFADPSAALGAFRGPLGLEMGQRNNLHGPNFSETDLALIKNFKVTEKVHLEFHAEAFNLFNHPSFALPLNGSGGVADITSPSSFGVITSTASIPREMQFALRLEF